VSFILFFWLISPLYLFVVVKFKHHNLGGFILSRLYLRDGTLSKVRRNKVKSNLHALQYLMIDLTVCYGIQ
jgi:hypothetical protein